MLGSLNLLELGSILARLHECDIVHEDLTTSNIMSRTKNSGLTSKKELFLIDFGLSHVSYSLEDKAVDLYLLERNFISSHPLLESEFEFVISGYMNCSSKASLITKKLSDGNYLLFVG